MAMADAEGGRAGAVRQRRLDSGSRASFSRGASAQPERIWMPTSGRRAEKLAVAFTAATAAATCSSGCVSAHMTHGSAVLAGIAEGRSMKRCSMNREPSSGLPQKRRLRGSVATVDSLKMMAQPRANTPIASGAYVVRSVLPMPCPFGPRLLSSSHFFSRGRQFLMKAAASSHGVQLGQGAESASHSGTALPAQLAHGGVGGSRGKAHAATHQTISTTFLRRKLGAIGRWLEAMVLQLLVEHAQRRLLLQQRA